MITYLGLFVLSAATLAFEVNLTRLFSVAQFYHFAFMIVSLALLGFGASGTFLSLFPHLRERNPRRTLTALSWGFALAAAGSYLLTLYLPFDSFRIAHDWRQGVVLALHYVALATPFFCSGTVVALLLAAQPERISHTYAANLAGSAAGCILAIIVPSWVGGEGVVLLSAALGLLSALTFQCAAPPTTPSTFRSPCAVSRGVYFVGCHEDGTRNTHHISRFTFHGSLQEVL